MLNGLHKKGDNMKKFALKGNIIYSEIKDEIKIFNNHYLICEDGLCKGVTDIKPDCEIIDHTNKIIMPGMSDIHIHAPQYTFRGIGADLQLLDWLNTYTFPEESKYADLEYAKEAYTIFTDDLKNSGTTRVCAFATIHNKATDLLMDMIEKSGVCGYIGKVSMDRNSPEFLCETDAESALIEFLENDKYKNVKPILTPRFIPTCSDELMVKIGVLQKEKNLPLQSHLSENPAEIEWVAELCKDAKHYGDAYHKRGTFGTNGKTIMAHCVHSCDDEINLMRENGVYVAHCPSSNANLSSGTALVKKFLKKGLNVGLGSDVAGGDNLSMFSVMREALKHSRILQATIDNEYNDVLTVPEVLYLATKGGGSFFGKVGSFEEGYEFDALVIDDSNIKTTLKLKMEDRIERMIYLADDRNIDEIYVRGVKIK